MPSGPSSVTHVTPPITRQWPLKWPAIVSCCGTAIIFAVHFFSIYHYQNQVRGDRLHDFPTFYAAAKLALQHGDIYTAGATPDVRYVYPPLIAFAFSPLTRLTLLQAAHLFLLLNTLMVFGSIALAAKAILTRFKIESFSVFWNGVFLCSLLSWVQTHNVLIMGETDAMMLFLFALAFYWLDANPLLAGLALGFAFNIKYLPIVVVPYLFVRRRWGAAGYASAGALFFALLPAVLLGWHETMRDLRVSMGGLLRWFGISPEQSHSIRVHDIHDDLSVSATSAIARVLQPHGVSNLGVMLLAAAVGLLVVLLIAWLYRRAHVPILAWPATSLQLCYPYRELVSLEWAGCVTAALVFSPDTNTRHLIMGVLANTLGAVLVVAFPQRLTRVALAGLIIIFVSYLMPFGRAIPGLHGLYYRFSIPGWGLLAGYVLILGAGLKIIAMRRGQAVAANQPESAPVSGRMS